MPCILKAWENISKGLLNMIWFLSANQKVFFRGAAVDRLRDNEN